MNHDDLQPDWDRDDLADGPRSMRGYRTCCSAHRRRPAVAATVTGLAADLVEHDEVSYADRFCVVVEKPGDPDMTAAEQEALDAFRATSCSCAASPRRGGGMTTPDMSDAYQMPQPDSAGLLAINGLPDEYQRAEDATADADRTRARNRNPRGHERVCDDNGMRASGMARLHAAGRTAHDQGHVAVGIVPAQNVATAGGIMTEPTPEPTPPEPLPWGRKNPGSPTRNSTPSTSMTMHPSRTWRTSASSAHRLSGCGTGCGRLRATVRRPRMPARRDLARLAAYEQQAIERAAATVLVDPQDLWGTPTRRRRRSSTTSSVASSRPMSSRPRRRSSPKRPHLAKPRYPPPPTIGRSKV